MGLRGSACILTLLCFVRWLRFEHYEFEDLVGRDRKLNSSKNTGKWGWCGLTLGQFSFSLLKARTLPVCMIPFYIPEISFILQWWRPDIPHTQGWVKHPGAWYTETASPLILIKSLHKWCFMSISLQADPLPPIHRYTQTIAPSLPPFLLIFTL